MQSKDPVLHASTPNDYEAGALFGLRLNAFADFSVDYDTGGTVWIADEFQEAASVSHTPSQAGGNIVLATCIADPDSRETVASWLGFRLTARVARTRLATRS